MYINIQTINALFFTNNKRNVDFLNQLRILIEQTVVLK